MEWAEGLDVVHLRHAVQLAFTRLALEPEGPFDIHTGLAYAVRWLGYDPRALARLPAEVTACFSGCGHPLAIAALPPGATVVDLGCGSGTDLLLAAAAVGPGGHAIGVEMTDELRQCAARAATALQLSHVEVNAADIVHLPLETASVDVALANALLALVPEKGRAMQEIARIVRPGGRLQIAELVIGAGDPQDAHAHVRRVNAAMDDALWICGLGGALTERELLDGLAASGFEQLQICARFDPFRGTLREAAARRLGAIAINLSGVRR